MKNILDLKNLEIIFLNEIIKITSFLLKLKINMKLLQSYSDHDNRKTSDFRLIFKKLDNRICI